MDIYNDVVYRLSQLGYTVPAGDTPDAAVKYAINRAAEKIKANINRTEIPDGLHYTWVDMAAGLFLFDKKTAGQLDEGFDFTAPAKKITEGDVSVEFAGADDGSSTPEARFELDSGLWAMNTPRSLRSASSASREWTQWAMMQSVSRSPNRS